ncbi:MAG: SDR family NAD(P)-dependent oxidoreductase, partial [Promethearchaeota archaeon]
MKLQNKVALITGGSQGIGRAIARAFASEGADIIINYHASDDAAMEAKSKVLKIGSRCMTIKADVSIKKDVESMISRILTEFGRIDILVNNAGMSRGMEILDLEESVWDQVINVNMKGTFLVSQAVAKTMLERRSGVI